MIRSLPLSLILLAACGEDGGVHVMSPSSVEFRWDVAYNDVDDNIAAVIPLDVLVYDALSGMPLADVAVTWHGEHVRFATPDAVLSTVTACAACVWSPYRDEFLEVEDGGLLVPLATQTDDDGVARVYAVVDSLSDSLSEGDDEAFAAASVVVRVLDRDHAVELVPR